MVPALWVRGAKFKQGGVSLKISIFGSLAGELLGISALRAQELENLAVKKHDDNRNVHREAVASNIGQVYCLSVDVKIMRGDANKPRLNSITAYHLAAGAAAVAAASSSASAKRAVGVDVARGADADASSSLSVKRLRGH